MSKQSLIRPASHLLSWLTGFLLMLASGLVQAQATIAISSASVFEGNAGTRFLDFPITFIGTTNAPTTINFSVIPLSGSGFTPATGAAACGAAGVDFVQFPPGSATFPAGSTGSGLFVRVVICGDTQIEAGEHIAVLLTVSGGGQCTADSCGAIGTIRNDDGTPTLSINNVTVSEPFLGNTTATFTVSSSFPRLVPITMNFATRNGTATGGPASCFPQLTCPGDYATRSGSLTIPGDGLTTTTTVSITVRGDTVNESNETFFVDLSAPVNATLADGTGRATIVNNPGFNVGTFALTADPDAVRSGEVKVYELEWTVPDPQVWRQLRSIDLRIRESAGQHFWLRWDETSNSFALCRHGRGPQPDDAPLRSGVHCSGAALPGSDEILIGDYAWLHLAGTEVTGSGPTGASVTLKLGLSFRSQAAGRTLTLEVAATDDSGSEDRFVSAGEVRVLRTDKH